MRLLDNGGNCWFLLLFNHRNHLCRWQATVHVTPRLASRSLMHTQHPLSSPPYSFHQSLAAQAQIRPVSVVEMGHI
jgi:hypothetical protein